MNLTIYQVDAFTDHVFGGNPAAVIPLESWLDDATLQAIASENNLSETAFIIAIDASDTTTENDVGPDENGHLAYELRWFTPVSEVAMCGHATLATAHVLFTHLGINGSQIEFVTKSGTLTVEKLNDGYSMDFPAVPSQLLKMAEVPNALIEGLNINVNRIINVSLGTDYLVELVSQADVKAVTPKITHWQNLNARGVIITAQADNANLDANPDAKTDAKADVVSRCFYPKEGVTEDPVTGSAHCQLTPYWAAELGKNKLTAVQLSKRRGYLHCELVKSENSDRVKLIGNAVDYMVGQITI